MHTESHTYKHTYIQTYLSTHTFTNTYTICSHVLSCSLSSTCTNTHVSRALKEVLWCLYLCLSCIVCVLCVLFWRDLILDFLVFACSAVVWAPHIHTCMYWGHWQRHSGACICASRAQWHRSMRIVCIILRRSDFWCLRACVLSGSLSSTYTYTHVSRALTVTEALWCLYLSFSCTVAS
jgi:hypothetical protein